MQLPATRSKCPTGRVAVQRGLRVIDQTWPCCYEPMGDACWRQGAVNCKTGPTASNGAVGERRVVEEQRGEMA